MNPHPHNRQHLRQQLRHYRRQLTAGQQNTAARQLSWKLARHPAFRRAKTLAFYWPNDGEISPLPLLRLALRWRKQCYLPRLPCRGFAMQFAAYKAGDRLYTGRYGIQQPGPKQPHIAAKHLDLILLPLVGFDQQGNRLGMGGGFYDRALTNCRPLRRLQLIGLAHQGQQLPRITHAHWDMPLQLIATDRTILRAG